MTFPPAWLDPGEVAVGGQTLFWILYALHDVLIKPMPGNLMTPSLAESWTVSDDQRVYEFKLREGLKFHNGDPFTAEDVKFTFLRYKSPILHEKQQFPLMTCESYTSYVGGRLSEHFDHPFLSFEATCTIRADTIPGGKQVHFAVQA